MTCSLGVFKSSILLQCGIGQPSRIRQHDSPSAGASHMTCILGRHIDMGLAMQSLSGLLLTMTVRPSM